MYISYSSTNNEACRVVLNKFLNKTREILNERLSLLFYYHTFVSRYKIAYVNNAKFLFS